MINWSKQTEDAFQGWADTQKKFWNGWIDAVEQQGGQAQLADTWRKAVDTWEDAVKSGLEAQLEVSRKMADSVSTLPNVPKDLQEWAEQAQELGTRWNGAQKELWESYFGMVRKAVPVKMLGTLDGENQKLFEAWQQAVDQVVAAQSEWADVWTEQAATTPKAKTTSRSKAKSAA